MTNLINYLAASPNKPCDSHLFLNFPSWYEYLPGYTGTDGLCSPQIHSLSDIWLIVAAVIEILLRVAAIVAVVFVIYGGFSYVTSQGEADATGRAKSTIVNALIGLAVAVMAAVIVSFIAKSIS